MSLFVISIVPLLFLAIVIIVVVSLIRAAGRAASGPTVIAPPPPPNVVTELAPDGFWIAACPAEPDSIIHYTFWTGQVRRTGQVPFRPGDDGRQFVYTGAKPERVSIIRIIEPADDIGPSAIPPIVSAGAIWASSTDDSPPPSPPDSSAPFPSAY